MLDYMVIVFVCIAYKLLLLYNFTDTFDSNLTYYKVRFIILWSVIATYSGCSCNHGPSPHEICHLTTVCSLHLSSVSHTYWTPCDVVWVCPADCLSLRLLRPRSSLLRDRVKHYEYVNLLYYVQEL